MNANEISEYFDYLDQLRSSGETNMYGAGPYLTREFDLDRRESQAVLRMWVDTFDPDKTAEERAAEALA